MELARDANVKVLLLSNYKLDDQASMQAFSQLMDEGLRSRGYAVRIVRPEPYFGKIKCAGPGVNKWLAYIDKYLLFLRQLFKQKKWADVIHICDHSNGLYVPFIADVPHVVTCHDLLAVRAGLGEDTCRKLSPVGWILQHWILSGLRKASILACDSTATMTDAERLIGHDGRHISLIPLTLNYPFAVLPLVEALDRLKAVRGLNASEPFILHVGSSHPNKNREGILRVFAAIKDQFAGQCVFAGSPLSGSQRQLAKELGVAERVIEVVGPEGELLEALYNRAFVFVFPSYFEGFGWPILEAQACGCPVIVSSIEPCPETAGKGAVIHHPDDQSGMAETILKLADLQVRQDLVALGLDNLKRFDADTMFSRYLELYERAIQLQSKKTAPFRESNT